MIVIYISYTYVVYRQPLKEAACALEVRLWKQIKKQSFQSIIRFYYR
jgi:hypothetical protein